MLNQQKLPSGAQLLFKDAGNYNPYVWLYNKLYLGPLYRKGVDGAVEGVTSRVVAPGPGKALSKKQLAMRGSARRVERETNRAAAVELNGAGADDSPDNASEASDSQPKNGFQKFFDDVGANMANMARNMNIGGNNNGGNAVANTNTNANTDNDAIANPANDAGSESDSSIDNGSESDRERDESESRDGGDSATTGKESQGDIAAAVARQQQRHFERFSHVQGALVTDDQERIASEDGSTSGDGDESDGGSDPSSNGSDPQNIDPMREMVSAGERGLMAETVDGEDAVA